MDKVERARRAHDLLATVGDLAAPCEGTFYVYSAARGGLTPARPAVARRGSGEGFGPAGAGWTRLSLATPDEVIDLGLEPLSVALQ
jgi:hypothetical protein